jgi:DNA-binding LacI/PurR family transcriptional regulator
MWAGYRYLVGHERNDHRDWTGDWGRVPASASESLQSQRTKLAAISIPDGQNPATQQLIRRAVDESFVSGFRAIMAIGAALAVASAVTSVTLIRRNVKTLP